MNFIQEMIVKGEEQNMSPFEYYSLVFFDIEPRIINSLRKSEGYSKLWWFHSDITEESISQFGFNLKPIVWYDMLQKDLIYYTKILDTCSKDVFYEKIQEWLIFLQEEKIIGEL